MIAVALVKPPSCTTSRPAASGPKLVMTRYNDTKKSIDDDCILLRD
jgi:hypothetical protein